MSKVLVIYASDHGSTQLPGDFLALLVRRLERRTNRVDVLGSPLLDFFATKQALLRALTDDFSGWGLEGSTIALAEKIHRSLKVTCRQL